MQTENAILTQQARLSLAPNWGLAVGAFAIYALVGIFSAIIPLGSFLLAGPLALGASKFSLALSRGQNPQSSQIFDGFSNFGTALGVFLLRSLYVFLGALLFIVPGIIIRLSYSQAFFILAEDDSIGVTAAMDKSAQMMRGHKMRFFMLNLRFIGWAILCIFTLGIGFFWLQPYVYISYAKFYDDLKQASSAPFSYANVQNTSKDTSGISKMSPDEFANRFKKLNDLHIHGMINDNEFRQQKENIIADLDNAIIDDAHDLLASFIELKQNGILDDRDIARIKDAIM